ncbi:unnamed protein product [Aureobasidium vineae]|uniref:Ubiquitin 3 binding protein But2 C-terminal domain-containing protein n=1 Tax=Aureobasidium vineae TaxID=2773715 RepID=A0A9N8JM61_9PEZI|nr:unnamed protein product [Aureobasidium vineae]
MKSIFVSAALIAAADALIARDSTCCFHLTASGGSGGAVGELADGQTRIGQTAGLANGQATFCIDSKGGLTDGTGKGCILTPPTSQFQCDAGASPTDGFSVSCDGTLSFDGNTDFKSCPTGDNGGYNIYTTAPAGQGGCVSIKLSADNCKSGCPAPAPPAPKTCPAALSGAYEYPHLIVPVDSKQPDKAFGTQYNGTVAGSVSSLFNFDIPSSDAGKTCSLVFLFPKQADLETSSFDFSGAGGIDFAMLKGPASSSTTYNNKPGVATDYGVTKVAPGNSYTIATFACPANSAIGFSLSTSDGTMLSYFQDYNPSPIGLYITVC